MSKKHSASGMYGNMNAMQRRKEQSMRAILADIEVWKSRVTSRGRHALIQCLLDGDVAVWMKPDSDNALYIKALSETNTRTLLDSYTDSELGEWFSLLTTVVLLAALKETGMQWKILGRDNPIPLANCPSLDELRSTMRLTKTTTATQMMDV